MREKYLNRNPKCSEYQDHVSGVFLRMKIKTLYSSAFLKAKLGKIKPNSINMIIINKHYAGWALET